MLMPYHEQIYLHKHVQTVQISFCDVFFKVFLPSTCININCEADIDSVICVKSKGVKFVITVI